MTQINLLRQVKNLNFPEWFLINWKIVTSVSSNNLTVAIKTLAWTDPTVYDPVYCRIDWVVRTITSALSVTINAWVNSFNSWSAELATKEIDYFVYLWQSTSWFWTTLLISRYPNANNVWDFSWSENVEKWAWNYGQNNTTDKVVNIWRFSAILSAWAWYTWSLWTWPVINYPIFETRWLDYVPTLTWNWTAPTWWNSTWWKYKIIWDLLFFKWNNRIMTAWVWNTTLRISLPFSAKLLWWAQYTTCVWFFWIDVTPNPCTAAINYSQAYEIYISSASINATAYYFDGNINI